MSTGEDECDDNCVLEACKPLWLTEASSCTAECVCTDITRCQLFIITTENTALFNVSICEIVWSGIIMY